MLDISAITHDKTDPSKTYFDLSFQTDNNNVRAACFSPEKCQRLKKYQEDSTSCVISSVVQDSCKTNEFKLTNFSTFKPKSLVFSKEANFYQFNSLDEVTNEFQLIDLVNVIVRIFHTGDIKTTNNNLTLKEYIATNDGKSQMKIPMFEQFPDQMERKHLQNFTLATSDIFKRKEIGKHNLNKS